MVKDEHDLLFYTIFHPFQLPAPTFLVEMSKVSVRWFVWKGISCLFHSECLWFRHDGWQWKNYLLNTVLITTIDIDMDFSFYMFFIMIISSQYSHCYKCSL